MRDTSARALGGRAVPEELELEDVESLLKRHEGRLVAFVARLTGDREVARDLVQETFLRYVRSTPEYRSPAETTAWLFGVARNLAINWMGRESRQRRGRELLAVGALEGGRGSIAGAAERRLLVAELLESLSLRQRTVVLLTYQEGFSYREIGRMTGMKVSHVSVTLHRAIRRLARELRRGDAKETR